MSSFILVAFYVALVYPTSFLFRLNYDTYTEILMGNHFNYFTMLRVEVYFIPGIGPFGMIIAINAVTLRCVNHAVFVCIKIAIFFGIADFRINFIQVL